MIDVPAPPRDIPAPALAAATGTLLLWSGTPVANKVAVAYMDGLTAGVLRSMLAGFCALGIAMALRLPFPPPGRPRRLLAVSGLSSFALWPALMSLGIARTTAGQAALIMALTPVFTVLIGAAAERRLPAGRWWMGAVVAIAGTAALLTGRGPAPGLPGLDAGLTGDLIVLGGAAICALGYVSGAHVAPHIGAVATTFWGLAVALVALVPTFLIIAPSTDWTGVPEAGWLAVGWMTLLSSLTGYALWFFALSRGGVGRVGSLQLAVPALSLAAAALVLRESVSWFLLASCAVIVGGTAIAQRAQARG